MSEGVMLSARVPEELKDLVDADGRANQEVVRAALWREFGGERKSDIQRRIEEKENRVSMIRREKNERDRELEREQNELEALRSKLDAVEQQGGQIESELDEILDQMETEGTHYYPNNGDVTSLATEAGTDAADIIHRLKKRAVEQERDIYHTQFKRADHARGETPRPIGEVFDGDE